MKFRMERGTGSCMDKAGMEEEGTVDPKLL